MQYSLPIIIKYTSTNFKSFFIDKQFNPNYDGDYISIQEIDSNGNQKLVAYLTSPDIGPKSESATSNWNKKIISSTANKMSIEFKSDDSWQYKGFSASIYFTPLSIKECESWLDMNKRIFKSPNHPQTYYNSMKCSWLITVDPDQHITLDVTEFYVRF